MKYAIDFTPLLEALLPIAGVLLSVLASYLIKLAANRFKLDIEAKHREVLQDAIYHGINYALEKTSKVLHDKGGKIDIEVKNQLLATGANYVLAAVPDALGKLGVTQARLRDLLEARLGVQGVGTANGIEPGIRQNAS